MDDYDVGDIAELHGDRGRFSAGLVRLESEPDDDGLCEILGADGERQQVHRDRLTLPGIRWDEDDTGKHYAAVKQAARAAEMSSRLYQRAGHPEREPDIEHMKAVAVLGAKLGLAVQAALDAGCDPPMSLPRPAPSPGSQTTT